MLIIGRGCVSLSDTGRLINTLITGWNALGVGRRGRFEESVEKSL